MSNSESRDIERLEYWQGQLLRSADFVTAQRADDQRRWWHNRALHSAYGASIGLEVTQEGSALRVACGLAYDCEGRELIVPAPARVPMPKVEAGEGGAPPESRALVLRWSEQSAPGGWPGECAPCGAGGSAAFAWIRWSRFDGRAGVPLAVVDWTAALVPTVDPDFEAPRSRPISRPHLGSGMTPPGGTVWESWSEVVPESSALTETIGIQTLVNTAAAGFAEEPVYIAQLQIASRTELHPLPPPICRIDSPTPESFLFRVWLPRALVQAKVKFVTPKTKVEDFGDKDKKVLKVKSSEAFRENDPVQKVGGDKLARIKKIPDEKTIELDNPIPGLDEDENPEIRLSRVETLTRLEDMLGELISFAGSQVQIDGVAADGAGGVFPVSLRKTVTVSGSAVRLLPRDLPPLVLGDKSSEAPQITVVSTQAVDVPLVVENLGWHVCWMGCVGQSGPEFKCTDEVCEVTATEVC